MNRLCRAACAFLVLALAACASAPVALVALPPAPMPESRDARPGASILLREVVIPGYLDSFPVVVGRDESTLIVSQSTEWAERPSLGVARVLRDAMSERVDASRVLIEGDGRVPDVDLTVEFVALDPRQASLHLDARWTYACVKGGGSRGGRTQLDVPVASATPAAVAAATTDALTRFAGVLVEAIPTDCRPFADDSAGGHG